MTKGILIYALGHQNYYHMAEVLAASLTVNDARKDGIQIGVICDDRSKIVHKKLFDVIIDLPEARFTVNGKIVFNHATVLIYDLSPFDVTIKLDADIVWLSGRKVSSLFDSLKNVALTFENNGFLPIGKADQTVCVWAQPLEIKKCYNLTGKEKCYNTFGEFIYFKKSDDNRLFFKTVRLIYQFPKVRCAGFANGTFTDELAFQIAMMQLKRYPHEDNFTPVYNLFLRRKDLSDKHSYALPENFYGYSIGGNATSVWQKQQYNILASHYFNTLGLQNPYQATSKKSFLAERINL